MKKLLCMMISIMVLLSNLTIYVQAEEIMSDLIPANADSSDMDELTPGGGVQFLNNTANGNTITCSVNLIYDGKYHERIIIKDKQLTVPIKITNTGSTAKDITCFIGEYDTDGKLISEIDLTPVRVGANASVAATLIREFDEAAKSAKIFIWEEDTLRPITNAISLTEAETDYYSNNFLDVQEYSIAYPIEGNINTSSDVDYIKFIPEATGSYTFNCISIADTLLTLYNSNQSALKTGASNFKYNLTAGQAYYLKMHGNTAGEYIVSVQYNTSSEADSFSIYDFDIDTNVYKKSILNMCEDLYYDDAELSKQMYGEYEEILKKETKLHALPDFLAGHPKELDNFDDIVNQYYSTKYESLAGIRQQYIDLIDQYTENDLAASQLQDNETENTNNNEDNYEYPIIGKHYPELYSTEGIEGDAETDILTAEQRAAASLTIISTTATTITVPSQKK